MPSPDLLTPEQTLLVDARRKRANKILVMVAILCVVVPFLFWRGTWFGRPLSEEEIGQYLADQEKPRHGQHALVQIGQRIGRGDAAVKRWYPEVVRLAASPHPEIRITLAWVLGSDNHSQEFHQTLLGFLQDAEPLVRRNAALSLVRFGDASGKPELLNMLRPYTLHASQGGVIHYRVKPGNSVDHGTVLFEIALANKEPLEIPSPLPGRVQSRLVEDGSRIAPSQEILILSPGSEHVWEALRALYLVGDASDLADVERFTGGSVTDTTAQIQEQANLTATEIRRRASQAGR